MSFVTKQLHCFLKFYIIKIKSGFKVYSISPFKELSTDTRERYEWSFPLYETGTYKTFIPPRHFHAGGFYISLFEHRIFLCQPDRSKRLQRPDGKRPELCARYQCGRLLPLSSAVSVFSRSLHSAVFFTLTMLAIVCFVILGSPVPPGLLTAVGMLLFLVLGILGSAVHYHFFVKFLTKNISHAWLVFPMGLLSCCSF